jgi:hypothetical protein
MLWRLALTGWGARLLDWLLKFVPDDFFDVEPDTMPLAELLATYRDGDEHGWETEFAWLRENDSVRLAELRADVSAHGIHEPVLLGDDGRVWDGHHRLCVAHDLALAEVPITRAW